MSAEKNSEHVLVIHDIASAFMLRRTDTEINRAERTIGLTWRIGAFAWHRVYSIDDYSTAEIKDKGQVLEGYSLPSFTVQLVGRRKHISIYSTDDAEDAMSVCGTINGFLGKPGISTQRQ